MRWICCKSIYQNLHVLRFFDVGQGWNAQREGFSPRDARARPKRRARRQRRKHADVVVIIDVHVVEIFRQMRAPLIQEDRRTRASWRTRWLMRLLVLLVLNLILVLVLVLVLMLTLMLTLMLMLVLTLMLTLMLMLVLALLLEGGAAVPFMRRDGGHGDRPGDDGRANRHA